MDRPTPETAPGSVRLIVVGASAGGVAALRTLVSKLPEDLPAAMLITLHIGSNRSSLPELLARQGPLPVQHGRDGEPLVHGRIHVAPPDEHMVVEGARLRLIHGPKEHHTRPAIDPMFRSAALAQRERVIGVVLTGRLDDGTAGLRAVKECGGLAVVQDPSDAEEPSMPASALRHAPVDHCVPLEQLPGLLAGLAHAAPPAEQPGRCQALNEEHQLMLANGDPMSRLKAIGRPSSFVCPDCGGGLWELGGPAPPRFRCHTGHGYSMASLLHAQGEAADAALWAALRGLQERIALLRKAATWKRSERDAAQATRLDLEADEIEREAEQFSRLLQRLPPLID